MKVDGQRVSLWQRVGLIILLSVGVYWGSVAAQRAQANQAGERVRAASKSSSVHITRRVRYRRAEAGTQIPLRLAETTPAERSLRSTPERATRIAKETRTERGLSMFAIDPSISMNYVVRQATGGAACTTDPHAAQTAAAAAGKGVRQ